MRCGKLSFAAPLGANTFLQVWNVTALDTAANTVAFAPHIMYYRNVANVTFWQAQCSLRHGAACKCSVDNLAVGSPSADGHEWQWLLPAPINNTSASGAPRLLLSFPALSRCDGTGA